MEVASLLAGQPWSDRPATTDPTLALVARGVNDNVSDPARLGLAPLVPAVVGTNTGDARIPARLIQVVTDSLAYGASSPRLARAAARAERPQAPDPPGRGLRERWRYYRVREGLRERAWQLTECAIRDLTRRGSGSADPALTSLLRAAITVTREITHPHQDAPVDVGEPALTEAARDVNPDPGAASCSPRTAVISECG